MKFFRIKQYGRIIRRNNSEYCIDHWETEWLTWGQGGREREPWLSSAGWSQSAWEQGKESNAWGRWGTSRVLCSWCHSAQMLRKHLTTGLVKFG